MTSIIEGRMVHQYTAAANLAHSSHRNPESSTPAGVADWNDTLLVTSAGLRYSLTQGKKGMTAAMQKASRSSVALALRRNSDSNTSTTSISNNSNSSGTKLEIPASTASSTSSSASKSCSAAVEMIKIFVLLLEPKTKTFELIQLVYPSATTTIGDILRMIPQHATELALGSQKYVGLCRPKDEQEMKNITQLASASANTGNGTTAHLSPGEILVAIPNDYTVSEVSKFSQAILTNRRFTKLLRRNNPLAPKLRKHSDRKTKDRKRSGRSRDSVHILEKHDEEGNGDSDQIMQRAMEKAATAAAQANADIPVASSTLASISPRSSKKRDGTLHRSLDEHLAHADDDSSLAGHSLGGASWIDSGVSVYSASTAGTDSLGDSLSSWSASLDKSFSKTAKYARHRNIGGISFNSSITTPPVEGARRRPNEEQGNLTRMGIIAALILSYLTVSYRMDQTHHHNQSPNERLEAAQNRPMGLLGLLYVIVTLLAFKKIQFLANRRQRKLQGTLVSKPPHESACPFVKIYVKWIKMWF
jgi:hypothetical protein